jgi:hypothetical protein
MQVDALVEYIRAREALRVAKESGAPPPWTDDAVLRTYRFTNVRREDDRTTRWMRAHWTGPHADRPAGEIVFNCGLFRYFGDVGFMREVGWQTRWGAEEAERVARVAARRHASGERVFTGAYVVPPPPSLSEEVPAKAAKAAKAAAICDVVMRGLWDARDELAAVARETRSLQRVGTALMRLPGYGGDGFMAKEVLMDLMHTAVLADPVDVDTWCPVGPGARRGLNRLAGRRVDVRVPFERLLGEMREALRGARGRVPFLRLHDVQFALCEFDKYERARTGGGRMKRKYNAAQ